jgi:hypothetical protein
MRLCRGVGSARLNLIWQKTGFDGDLSLAVEGAAFGVARTPRMKS